MNSIKQKYLALNDQSRRAFWMILIYSSAMLIFGFSLLPKLIQARTLLTIAANSIPLIMGALPLWGAFIILGGRTRLGGLVVIFTSLAGMLILPMVVQGYGPVAAAVAVIVSSLIAVQTQDEKDSLKQIIFGLTIGIFILILDNFWPLARLAIKDNDFIFAHGLALVLVLIYAGLVIKQFNNLSLTIKLIITSLAITLIPMVAVGFASTNASEQALIRSADQSLVASASQVAARLDAFVLYNLDSVRTQAQIGKFIEVLEMSPEQRLGSESFEDTNNILASFKQRDPVYITSYALLDLNGIDIADTVAEEVGLSKLDRDYFREPINTGLPYVSDVRISPVTGDASFYFSAPIRNTDGVIVGLLRVRYDATVLQQIVISQGKYGGQDALAMLVSDENILLVHSAQPELIARSIVPLTNEEVAVLRKDLVIASESSNPLWIDLPDLARNIAAETVGTGFVGEFHTNEGEPLVHNEQANAVKMVNRPWVVVVGEPQDVLLAPVDAQRSGSMFIGIIAAGLSIIVAVLISRFLAGPIVALTGVAQQVAGGNLSARASVTSHDETGKLAGAFNQMASQLNNMVTSLEQRVSERTKALATSAEVSRRLSTILEQDKLVKEVVEELQRAFNHYHVHIYLFDADNTHLLMAGGTGDAGKAMLASGHQIVRGRGLVGRAAESGMPVLVPDVASADGWLPNPLLPETKAELAVPIVIGDQVLGVLDVQQNQVEGLKQEDTDLLQSIANQVAVALQNARAYDNAQHELEERRRTEQLVESQRRSLQAVLDNMPAGVFMVEAPSGKPILSNRAAEDLLGRGISPDAIGEDLNNVYQAYKINSDELYPPADMPVVAGMFGLSKSIDDMEVRKPDGSKVLLQVNGAPILDASGNIVASVAVFQNITEQKHAQDALDSQRRTLQAVLDNMPAGVFMVEAPSGKPILSNKRAEDFLGRGISPTAVGEDLNQVYQAYKFGTEELYPPAEMPVVAGLYGQAKSISDMEVRKPDGSRVLLDVAGTPVYDANGNLFASVVVFQDITEKMQAQAVLESQRRTLQAVLDNMPAGVFMVEAPSGKPILTNKRAEDFLGRGISPNAIGDDLNQVYQAYKFGTDELYPPAEMPVVAGLYGQAKTISDMEVRKPDGSKILLEVNGAPVFDDNGAIIASVVVFTDITERHQLEDTILQEREQLAEALDVARMVNWEFDLVTGNFIFNDRFYHYLGTTAEAEGGYVMLPQVYASKYVHPDSAADVGANVPLAIATTDPNYTYEGLSKQILASGEVRDVIIRFTIEKDAQGRTIRLFGANQDVTDQRRQEEIIARRAAELATVSQVATTVATILSPDEMLQTVVDLTKASFELYHAHIYLLNEAGDTLVLARGAGEVGRHMVAEGRQIALNAEKSLVARAARTKAGVIVNDVRLDPDFLPHPLLPDTRSEMAVPMLVGEKLLGVLDVQAVVVNRFTDEDVMIKTTLSSQAAIALQNARQYEQSQAAERLVRSVIDATPDWIFIKDQQHRYRLVNQGYANSLHIKPEDFIGKDDLELGFPEDLVKGNPEKGITGFWADDRGVMDSGAARVYPNDIVMIDGVLRTFNTIKTPLRDSSGQVSGILAFGRDVTEREVILKDTAVLYAVTSRLSRSRTQKEVLDAVVEGTILQSFDTASIYFFNRPWTDSSTPEIMVTEAVWEAKPGSVPVRLGQPLPIQALPGIEELRTKPYTVVEDIRTDGEMQALVREMLEQSGMISLLTIRLLVGGEWVGCISATSAQPKTLSEQDVRRLLTLVDQATTVIYGLTQNEATQALARREKILREITARVRGSMDPEAILRTAVREIGSALGRQTFIRLGSADQLVEKPVLQESPGNNGDGSTSVTGEGGK